ncbi:thiamine-monophosphate kinase [Variibacter gotjawalensis]|uniref:Thiamine-monophosphate kinase n=1 Tax=Variibacter gotjawalensis TaxID=1333996 RepID=A0A0S3PXB4_9BRAD|nr:thiamine-phosphate kinase [Variibacter gotjawalensis]NIK46399.1 thiamine-monophosphate kinase [Variibacter gotjawalensis]RZS48309.1 thiamine-phosphate kinase [Variibacter gotjawalensis]BAT60569.1 thiamine-monophosphate kinase [Variibacter gotjawalensis]
MGRDDPRISGEDRLIAEYFRPIALAPGAMDLRDDAAFFTPPDGHDLVLTKDALVAGVHFFPDDPPRMIAQKALRVNLSDLAAKGAVPAGFLLALALPKPVDTAWLAAFSAGLQADAEEFACPLLGGDTVTTAGPITISITALGTLPRGTMVHREGAQAGDHIFVSGTIGDAALGLRLPRGGAAATQWGIDLAAADYLVGRYLVPHPRVGLTKAIRDYASSAMDVSDGLAGDLAKLCLASGVSADVDVTRIPLSTAAAAAVENNPDTLVTALTGGDDYEIVCTVAEDRRAAFIAAAQAASVDVVEIGRIVVGDAPPRFTRDGKVFDTGAGSFSHF